jgi:hypothetical protein
MMIFKTGMQLLHPQHGLVSILDDSGTCLVQVETTDGSIFYISRASFIEKKKVTKPREKKPKKVRAVRKVESETPDLAEEIEAATSRGAELPDGIELPEGTELSDDSLEELLNQDAVQLGDEEEPVCVGSEQEEKDLEEL